MIVKLVRIIKDSNSYSTNPDYYEADVSVTDFEQSFRNAIAEFLETDAGKKAIEETCQDFNWGDATYYVPNEILKKHGIRYLRSDAEVYTVNVDNDEILCK